MKLNSINDQLLNKVSRDSLMSYNQNICREVRLSGTYEELRAFEFVQSTLESFGLITELKFCKAYISLPRKASILIAGEKYNCITHSMGRSVDSLEGELIYTGNKLLDEPYKGAFKKRIILLEGLATPADVVKAASYNVSGIIFINGDHTHEMIVSPVWGNPVPETKGLLPDIPVISVTSKIGKEIKDKTQSDNCTAVLTTEVETSFRSIPMLTTEIKGTEDNDQFVLFSGHIDSWHYGAMDNGSANAVMLEIARVISLYQDQLKRTLRIAFWSGHSHGRYAGSAWYCDHHWEDLWENCFLHVNIDSVGAKGAEILSEANCMAETKEIAQKSIMAITGKEFNGSRFGRAGDQSFWGTGTPSLFMGLSEQLPNNTPSSKAFSQLFGAGNSGGFGWWWHTSEDTMDKIDPENLSRDCKIYLHTLIQVLDSSILPINQLKAVEEIEKYLVDWQEKAGDHIDLSVTKNRVLQVKKNLIKLDYKIKSLDEDNKEDTNLINETIMDLSRILVPLNYIKGNIFTHDLALKQPPIPKLSDIAILINLDENTNEYHFIRTSLQRQRNEINYSLKKAVQLLEKRIRELE